MSTWDETIFSVEVNEDFFEELSSLGDDDVVEAIEDACMLAARQAHVSDDELHNGLAAATVAAIWAGAPYSAGDVVESYPFIRQLSGEGSDELREVAAELLENNVEDYDVEVFLEALN